MTGKDRREPADEATIDEALRLMKPAVHEKSSADLARRVRVA
jgi:hypothetical protein